MLVTLRSGQADPWVRSIATGHCYQIVDKPVTWPQAFNICRDDGGMLTVIESAEEQLFIQGQVQPTSFIAGGLWIGAENLHTAAQRAWINGLKFSFTAWAPNHRTEQKVNHKFRYGKYR
ncbi:hypothetical protein CHS0354_031305 [Potamilus streckersoni]|uniref:C-type lectin domain-containing protein n=1 Tax=Potamilus streckersoni TaxID=2493646 RepID=A0AAE0TD98_9BIVA|nr:hypothetical protein CHS0354_031305 [Potamilus streckersoni]